MLANIAIRGQNNNFILKFTNLPNVTISKIQVIVPAVHSVHLLMLNVSSANFFANFTSSFKILIFAEETVSLESPPAENGGHNLSEIISGVLPGDQSSEDSKRLFAQRGVHGPLRNGSLTVRKPTNLGPFLVTFWAFIKSIS